MSTFYNEIDPNAAEWLRQLIDMGQIPDGEVNEESIINLDPEYVTSFTQCHFFAGIGVWAYALRRAGWSDDRPVWTGSCPCQPFSNAGTRGGFEDDRHLWPAWNRLIVACRPPVIFGEQVGGAAAIGKVNRKHDAIPGYPDGWAWFDHVQTDLEASHYAVAARSFTASSVGAPHIRQRLYFMADSSPTTCDEDSELGNTNGDRCVERGKTPATVGQGNTTDTTSTTTRQPCPTNGFWRDADWLKCRDGKWRPVESGSAPLVNGSAGGVVPSGDPSASYCEGTGEARPMRLKGYGNAIVAPQAEMWIRAYMGVIE